MDNLTSHLADVASGWQGAMLRVCQERDDLKRLLEDAIDLLADCDAGTQGHDFVLAAKDKLNPSRESDNA